MASTTSDSDRNGRRIDAKRVQTEPIDSLRLIVQVSLAVYLTPVVVLVCAIGGASIMIDKAGRLARRWMPGRTRGEHAERLTIAQSSWVESGRTTSRRPQRTNIGH